jgi:phosphoenolpyruvate carboxykinase (ATP)
MCFWTRARPGVNEEYDRQAQKLVNMFADNFAQYVPYIADDVKAAAIG